MADRLQYTVAMKMMTALFATLMLSTIVTAGCASDPDPSDPGNPGNPGDPGQPRPAASAEQRAIQRAHATPDAIYQTGVASAQLGINSALVASQSQGGLSLVTTGTVTFTATSASYAAAPADRLVVKLPDGKQVDFTFDRLSGDFSGDAANLLGRDHAVSFRAVQDGTGDMQFESLRQGGQYQVTARGVMIYEGTSYDIDLTSAGVRRFENDSSGGTSNEDSQTRGSVRAAGFDLTIDETWSYQSIWTTGSGRGHDSASTRIVNSRLQLGTDVYQWNGARTQKSFRDGKPSQLDSYWKADGLVTRNGAPYGQYRMSAQNIGSSGGFIYFLLSLPSGDIQLEKWAAY